MKEVPAPRVAAPCPMDWETMQGDDKRRFCGHCQLHVHNLSAASAPERADVLAAAQKGDHVCVTFAGERAGMMFVPSGSSWLRTLITPVRWAVASLLALFFPVLFGGCASRQQTVTMGRTCVQGEGGMGTAKSPGSGHTTTGAVAPQHP